MLFKIEQDTGAVVSGWLVLDQPDAIPRFRILTSAGSPVDLEANVVRPGLKARGVHTTGKAGFRIDSRTVPNIAQLEDLEIQDADSGFLLYRRQKHSHLSKRLFRCDLQTLPQSQLEGLFSRHFAVSHCAVERYSFDQLSSIIANAHPQSVHISGRPLFNRYEQLLRDNGFISVAMLRDPYEELAEKLLFARFVAGGNGPASLSDYLTGYEPLLELAQGVDLSDEASLYPAFRNMTGRQRDALSNPFTRILACDPTEMPTHRHLGLALTNLARMNLVGVNTHYEDFSSSLAELLETDILQSYQPTYVSWAPVFGAKLAQIDEVKALLSIDVELYSYVCEAVETALGKL